MKSHKITKKVLITAAVIVVLATATFAGIRGSMIIGHSSRANDFTELPTQTQLQKDFGFAPSLIEDFSNGYEFEIGTPVESAITDENGKEIETYKALSLRYTSGKESVSLNANAAAGDLPAPGAEVIALDDLTLYYSTLTHKFVPADYQKTAQELLDEENGKLGFGYGADEISISQSQTLQWSLDGVNYELQAMDSTLTCDDLVAMAQELMA